MKKFVAIMLVLIMGVGLGFAQFSNETLSLDPYYWRKESFWYQGFEKDYARDMLSSLAFSLVDYTSRHSGYVVDVTWFGSWSLNYRPYVQASYQDKQEALQRLNLVCRMATEAVTSFMQSGTLKITGDNAYYATDLIQAIANMQLCAEILRDSYEQNIVYNGYKGTSYYESWADTPAKSMHNSLKVAPGYLFNSVWYILDGTVSSETLRQHPAMRKVYQAYDMLKETLTEYGFLWYKAANKGRTWGPNPKVETVLHSVRDIPLK